MLHTPIRKKIFVYVGPRSKKYAEVLTLLLLYDTWGIPNKLVYDWEPDQVVSNNHFQSIVQKLQIQGHQDLAYTQNQNQVEDTIREIKLKWGRIIIQHQVPKCL